MLKTGSKSLIGPNRFNIPSIAGCWHTSGFAHGLTFGRILTGFLARHPAQDCLCSGRLFEGRSDMRLVTISLLLCVLGAVADDDPKKADGDKFKGEWKTLSVKQGGQASPMTSRR